MSTRVFNHMNRVKIIYCAMGNSCHINIDRIGLFMIEMQHRQKENFAKKVEAMSAGRLKIKVFGAGQLVPAFEVFDAASKQRSKAKKVLSLIHI